MAIAQPLSTDKLNSPDHSLSHRVFANDTAAPVQSIIVDSVGSTKISKGLTTNVTVVTNTYDVLTTDYTVICNKATAFTVTLPVAVVGQMFNIVNIGAGDVTIEGNGADTINGELNQTISTDDAMTVQCYVANKWIIL